MMMTTTTTTTTTTRMSPEAQTNTKNNNEHVHLRAAFAGACAGALAKTVVAPIERVKLLMQLQASLKNNTYMKKNSFQVASMIYRHEGILAFWRGNYHNVLQQAGTSALNFMFMDYYKAIAVRWNSEHEKSNINNSLLASFLSGGLAGGTATTVLYPIQFLRTRLAADVGSSAHRSYPNGMRDVLRTILHVDGIRGLYQGYGIALVGIFVYRSLHLGGYDAIKTWLQQQKQNQQLQQQSSSSTSTSTSPLRHQHEQQSATHMTWTEKFVAAQFVSLTAGTVCYPIDSVRRRLMMQAGQLHQPNTTTTTTTTTTMTTKPAMKRYRNSIHAFQVIFREEGIQGFYRGLGPNLVRSLGAALLLVSYDAMQQGMMHSR